MSLHSSTFEYLKPTELQLEMMAKSRQAFAEFAATIDGFLPDGPDKTYIMRELRSAAMWATIAITRQPDGSPKGGMPR